MTQTAAVETLGSEPAVVAQGLRTKNLVPISAFLRRNPNLMAIQTAIGETVRAGVGLSSITPKNDRVIRTEVVKMSDGRIHGVHVWIGPPDLEPPERPIPGPLIWDLTNGVATDTPESLRNSGWDPDKQPTHGRAFADDLPRRDLNPSEAKVLSMAIKPEPGTKFCSTWDVTDFKGEPITISFVSRVLEEDEDDGTERLICRAMNWRSEREDVTESHDNLAQRILNGLAQSGVHRVLVDLQHWKLLKWLDEPAPFFNWRARESGDPTSTRRRAAHGKNDNRVRLSYSRRLRLPAVRRMGAGPHDHQSRRAGKGHVRRFARPASADGRRDRRRRHRRSRQGAQA